MRELILPWPAKELSPNARVHWSKRAKAAKAAKQAGWAAALSAKWTVPAGQRIALSLVLHPPDLRHRDDDNHVGRCKAYRDGIAAAIGIDDRWLYWQPGVSGWFGEPVNGGEVRIRMTTTGEAQ